MSVVTSRGLRVPRYRIGTSTIRDHAPGGSSGVRSKAVPAKDDDPVTLGLAAARATLDGSDVDAVYFATATPLYTYGSATPLLTEALGLDEATEVRTFTESNRAGTAALGAAADAADARGQTVLVVAADVPTPAQGSDREKTAGAGAGAVVIEPGGDGLAFVGRGSCTRNLLEAWQAPEDEQRHEADDRFARDIGYVESTVRAVERAVDAAGWANEDVDALVVNQPNPRFPGRISRELGLHDDAVAGPGFASQYGDLGSASALAVLSWAELGEGDRVVVGSYGAGVADAYSLRVEGRPPSPSANPAEPERLGYVEYLQHIGHLE